MSVLLTWQFILLCLSVNWHLAYYLSSYDFTASIRLTIIALYTIPLTRFLILLLFF